MNRKHGETNYYFSQFLTGLETFRMQPDDTVAKSLTMLNMQCYCTTDGTESKKILTWAWRTKYIRTIMVRRVVDEREAQRGANGG